MKKAISIFLVFAVIFQLYLPVAAFANANAALDLSAGTSIVEYTAASIDNYADTIALSDQELDTVKGAFWWAIAIWVIRRAVVSFVINQWLLPPRPAY